VVRCPPLKKIDKKTLIILTPLLVSLIPIMEAKTCKQCKQKNNFLMIEDKARGDSYYQYGDSEKMHGPLPEFSSITNKNGCAFKICVGCGWISGLNLETLRKQINEAFAEEQSIEDSKEEILKKKPKKDTGSKTNKKAPSKETGSKTNKKPPSKDTGSKSNKKSSKDTGSKTDKKVPNKKVSSKESGSKTSKKESGSKTNKSAPKKSSAKVN